jgi:hypothetical protein
VPLIHHGNTLAASVALALSQRLLNRAGICECHPAVYNALQFLCISDISECIQSEARSLLLQVISVSASYRASILDLWFDSAVILRRNNNYPGFGAKDVILQASDGKTTVCRAELIWFECVELRKKLEEHWARNGVQSQFRFVIDVEYSIVYIISSYITNRIYPYPVCLEHYFLSILTAKNLGMSELVSDLQKNLALEISDSTHDRIFLFAKKSGLNTLRDSCQSFLDLAAGSKVCKNASSAEDLCSPLDPLELDLDLAVSESVRQGKSAVQCSLL